MEAEISYQGANPKKRNLGRKKYLTKNEFDEIG